MGEAPILTELGKRYTMNSFYKKTINLIGIIIPTHNRPEYLRRILSYYNEYGGDYDIIVADSSSDEVKKRNKSIISSFSNLNILYLSYSSKIPVSHKIADAVNYVEEKYCVLCADDDFIILNGINQSMDFLDNNPDFTVAHGRYISFYTKIDKTDKRKFFCTRMYHHQSITFPDAKSRFFFHLSTYQPTFYALHRTDFMKMIFKETTKYASEPRFGELLPSMLSLIYGKMKILDVLYAAREHVPRSLGQTCGTLKDFIKTDTYNKKYARFKDCLVMHLSKKSLLDIEEAKELVDGAMAAYLYNYNIIPGDYKDILVDKMKSLSKFLRLPDRTDEIIRALYRYIFLEKQRRKNDFRSFGDVFSSKYYKDLNRIRRHVLQFKI